MTTLPEGLGSRLKTGPRTWLVTGAAGFIGSHITEALLHCGQNVVGLDDLSTGRMENLDDIRAGVGEAVWRRFRFLRGDIRDAVACREASRGADFVLHQAALGSVPRSIAEPRLSFDINVTGFLNILEACRENGVQRLVYASSSSVYGDDPRMPKREDDIGDPLSPYALSKRVNEELASVYGKTYGLQAIGLRYFNVFGPRQNPDGDYAAVIPRWVRAMIRGDSVKVFGDGLTTRDFCFVANAVQANLLAALTDEPAAPGEVFNVAVGGRTSLNELFALIRQSLAPRYPRVKAIEPIHEPPREGDIPHSQADIAKAGKLLGYVPAHGFEAGIRETTAWFADHLA